MEDTRASPPPPRITRQSTGSERDRDRLDHAHSAAAQAQHHKTQLTKARRHTRDARAEIVKLGEDHQAELLAANARFGKEREELYVSWRSADDALQRDIDSSRTQNRMDEDAKYHLSQVIADVHRRLDREKSANHGGMGNRHECTAHTPPVGNDSKKWSRNT